MDALENSVADRLAAALEHSAELVDAGGFDVDVERALSKLAQFQLADPRAYVIRLAEAGLLGGASRLCFEVEATGVRVAFEPSPDSVVLSKTTLERLTSVLVSRAPLPGDAAPRAMLVQLAVAALAISRLEPSWFAIESVAADGRGYRQVYAPESRGEELEGAVPGTRIETREPVGLVRLVVQRRLLVQHCRHVRTPIVLDGERISCQPLFAQPNQVKPLFGPGLELIGEAGFESGSHDPAQVLLLSNGLLIESKLMPDWTPGFRASLDLPLPRDLSQSAVVRGPELEAALEIVADVHRRLADQPSLPMVRREAAVAERPSRAVKISVVIISGSVAAIVMVAATGSLILAIPAFTLGVLVSMAKKG